jgi:purine-binding chemotaxis protein CheW
MPETTQTQDNDLGEKYLIFSIFGRQYAFPAQIIGEVASCEPLYPLPLLPSYVLGVINRYSIPYALFDTGLLLSQKPGPRNEALVIVADIDRVAFSIERVTGIADIGPDKLHNVGTGTGTGVLSSAVYTSFKWNNDDVYVIDVRRLLARVSDEAET